jgi:hypothetical protein
MDLNKGDDYSQINLKVAYRQVIPTVPKLSKNSKAGARRILESAGTGNRPAMDSHVARQKIWTHYFS